MIFSICFFFFFFKYPNLLIFVGVDALSRGPVFLGAEDK